MKGIKTTILFVIIVTLIIYYHLIPGESDGLIPIGFLWICFLYIVGIVLIFLIFYKSIKQYRKIKRKKALTPIYISLFVCIINFAILSMNYNRDNSPVFIRAEQWKGLENHTILLKQNKTFEYSLVHIDIGNTIIGRYKLLGDSIFLSDSIRGDSIIFDRFYYNNDFLIPIKNGILLKDSTKYFKIKK